MWRYLLLLGFFAFAVPACAQENSIDLELRMLPLEVEHFKEKAQEAKTRYERLKSETEKWKKQMESADNVARQKWKEFLDLAKEKKTGEKAERVDKLDPN